MDKYFKEVASYSYSVEVLNEIISTQVLHP